MALARILSGQIPPIVANSRISATLGCVELQTELEDVGPSPFGFRNRPQEPPR